MLLNWGLSWLLRIPAREEKEFPTTRKELMTLVTVLDSMLMRRRNPGKSIIRCMTISLRNCLN